MKIIKVFDNSIDAHLLKSKLESEDITCFIFDENIVSLNPLYSQLYGGIKLKVLEKDEVKALQIIKNLENTPYTDEANNFIVCKNCGSTDINNKFTTYKNVSNLLSVLISLFFVIYPPFLRKNKKCNNCGNEF